MVNVVTTSVSLFTTSANCQAIIRLMAHFTVFENVLFFQLTVLKYNQCDCTKLDCCRTGILYEND